MSIKGFLKWWQFGYSPPANSLHDPIGPPVAKLLEFTCTKSVWSLWGDDVRWFDLDASGLAYLNLMGASRIEDRPLPPDAVASFSDVSWCCYVIFVLVLLVLGWLIFRLVKHERLNIGSY